MGRVRRRGDRVQVSLEPAEVAILTSLTSQVLELLGSADPPAATDQGMEGLLAAASDPVETPQDPALLRLLPSAYRDDDEAAAEFRRLTEADLRVTKRDGLSRIMTDLMAAESTRRDGGVRLDLDDESAAAWLPALTDVRLTIGTRIGVTEDMEAERMTLPVDSVRYAEIATYDWFSWLQDAMVRALTGD